MQELSGAGVSNFIISNSAIRDTVTAVFGGRDYALHGPVSLWDLLFQWIAQLIYRLFGLMATHPAIGFILRVAVMLALVLVAARTIYTQFAQHHPRFRASGIRSTTRARNWWLTAQQLAANGDYTAAAHALYLALITAAAAQGLVLLDDSRTVGDYVREMGRSRDATSARIFARFTRSYETVIYGIGSCDATHFAGLSELAVAAMDSLMPPLQPSSVRGGSQSPNLTARPGAGSW